MARDHIVVGSQTPSPKGDPTMPEHPSREAAICGAMSQQRGDSGNRSAPQKFVHLVGCRDGKLRPDARVQPGPVKR